MTNNFNIIFVSFIGLISSSVTKSAAESYDYCDPKLKLCDESFDHVMCKYPVSGPSDKCTQEIYEPLQAVEKQRILLLHNKFRSMIASSHEDLPTASNMRELYWDRELELLAERWAQQCVSITASKVYDECRNIKRFQVSQNVGTRRVYGATIDKQAPQTVVAWFKENKDFLPSYVDEFPQITENGTAVKQVANMIWANSYAIGCARAIFQENPSRTINGSRKNTWTVERLICNYGPSEDMVGKPVYKKGAPCANCPKGTTCSQVITGLCAIPITEMFHRMINLDQRKKGSWEEKIPQTSAEDEEVDAAQIYNHGNQISVSEIHQNAKVPKSGKYLIKKGIYVNGRCSLIRHSGLEGLNNENPDRISVYVDTRKVTDQCVVILVHKKKGPTDKVNSETQRLTMENEEMRKTERDISTQKLPQNGEPCVCYVPKKRKFGDFGTAPRIRVALFLFYAVTFLRLLLL